MFNRFLSGGKEALSGPWKELESSETWEEVKEASHTRPQIILKHSTSCGISSFAKYRLEEAWPEPPDDFDLNYLDILGNRALSNLLARELKVAHHSPQVIIIWNGEPVFDCSHHRISRNTISSALEEIEQSI